MRKRLIGILASIAVIAAACGGATTSSAPPASQAPGTTPAPATPVPSVSDRADEQILNIDLGQEPPTLDPNKAQDNASIAVLHALHRPLVYFDKDLKVVPALAEKYEISPDGKTFTFTLRDAKYSNGDAIVAADLVYSWKRLLDPRIAAPYAYVMTEVVGAPELLAASTAKPLPSDAAITEMLNKLGVAAPDPKTFVVTLSKPATYFLSIVALWITVPVQEKWITSPNATEAANYVSSGPYILEKWAHASQIVLKPNPNWYGEQKSILTQINMTMTVEPAQSQAAYEAGELAMNVVPAADILRVKDDPELGPELREIPNVTIDYYDYNNGVDPKGLGTLARCADPKACPTMNKNFRIALTRAIDKKALLAATWAGLGEIANSFIQPGIPGHDKDLDPYPFDVAKAKEALALALTELGIPDVASLPKLKFGYNTGSDHENRVAFMAEAWRTNLGVQTDQIGTDFSLLLTQRTAGVYQIARDGWGADYPHANNQLGNFVCGGGNNNNNWCNKDFDALLSQAATEADQAKQEDLYKQAQKLLIDDASMIPLRWRVTAYEIKPYLGGLNVTPTDAWLPGDLFYETMYIKKQ